MKVWDLTTFQEVLSPRPDALRPYCVTFSPDSFYLLADAANNAIKVWEVQTGRELPSIGQDIHGTMCLAFSPNGRRLARGQLVAGTTLISPDLVFLAAPKIRAGKPYQNHPCGRKGRAKV